MSLSGTHITAAGFAFHFPLCLSPISSSSIFLFLFPFTLFLLSYVALPPHILFTSISFQSLSSSSSSFSSFIFCSYFSFLFSSSALHLLLYFQLSFLLPFPSSFPCLCSLSLSPCNVFFSTSSTPPFSFLHLSPYPSLYRLLPPTTPPLIAMQPLYALASVSPACGALLAPSSPVALGSGGSGNRSLMDPRQAAAAFALASFLDDAATEGRNSWPFTITCRMKMMGEDIKHNTDTKINEINIIIIITILINIFLIKLILI